MALNSGVNLVVELPVNYAVSSAESFAAGALKVLDYIKADSIAFGSESGDIERLSKLAHILCDNEDALYKEISKCTFSGFENIFACFSMPSRHFIGISFFMLTKHPLAVAL